jgi:hypothetical protein
MLGVSDGIKLAQLIIAHAYLYDMLPFRRYCLLSHDATVPTVRTVI